jgi:sulfate/thiosulfate transport system substrate-binding protein
MNAWFLKRYWNTMICALFCVILVAGCAGPQTASSQPSQKPVKLVLGAYSTPQEAYKELIPLFQKEWKAKTGQDVTFEESYQGSGAQARAIAQGFEADIAALSLEADVNSIVKAGLITHDWKSNAIKGMVATSVVAFAVRQGNPKGIHDWSDLAKPGLQILTPNPKTSGGAMWNILALYGAAKRGFVTDVPKDDDAAAQKFTVSVLKNVTVMDKDARSSITNYEKGVGDVAITYENEVVAGQQSGQKYDLVIPQSTILIENPVALIDSYVDKHGSRAVAEAFIQFLVTPEAQQVFAKHGFRPVEKSAAQASASSFAAVKDLFTIDYFGGWKKATPDFFGDNGLYGQMINSAQQK